MNRISIAFGFCTLLFACPRVEGQQSENDIANRKAERRVGDPAGDRTTFGSVKTIASVGTLT